MILLGCLLAFSAAIAPRVVLVLAWIFSDRWERVWQGDILLPILGIVFLPYTTIMYLLVWTPTGLQGWDWMWIILGLLLDFMKWGQMLANRREAQTQTQKYYPEGAPGASTVSGSGSAAVSSGQAPASTSPTAADQDAAASTASDDASSGSSGSSGGDGEDADDSSSSG